MSTHLSHASLYLHTTEFNWHTQNRILGEGTAELTEIKEKLGRHVLGRTETRGMQDSLLRGTAIRMTQLQSFPLCFFTEISNS